MVPTLIETLKALGADQLEEAIASRRYLHAHPELSFQERETSLYIQEKLTELGIGWQLCGTYGIVASIKGEIAGESVVALRADFDGLPIMEQNEVDYISQNPGVMHACGHDVHTASLLSVAAILKKLQSSFRGEIKLIFQPAEEKFPGGAKAMVQAGALRNPSVQAVIAQHVMPELEAGKVGIKSGMYAAANDEVNITVFGRGGHGSQPQSTIDPVVVAAQIILALQQIVSRKANPTDPTVLSIGKMVAAGANNIIPAEVQLQGTLRTFNQQWRNQAHGEIKKIAMGIAVAMGATCEVHIQGFANVYNDPLLTDQVKVWMTEFMGPENVVDLDYWMAGEDFGEFTRDIPGCYYRVGSGNRQKSQNHPLHHPNFDVDEEPLFLTASPLMAYIALKQLGN